MVSPNRESIFVPGELTAKHAQILNNKIIADRCSSCHPKSHGNILFSQAGAKQDKLCLSCHSSHMSNAALRSPHDLPADQLVALGKFAMAPSKSELQLVSAPTQPIDWQNIDLTCAKCHREHHGCTADLREIGSTRCQACHKNQFEALAKGHPEFDNYPESRPRGLAFSHNAHAEKYFAQKNRQFDCRGCHLDRSRPGSMGPIFRTLGFDQACADCHVAPIRAATIDGWTLLQIPSVDLTDTINAAGGFSDWPENARFGYEGQFSPVLKILLQSDTAVAKTLAGLPASGKLADVADGQRGSVARDMAQAIRRLIDDTARDGQAAWSRRIATTLTRKLGRSLYASEHKLINDLCAGLPPDLFRQIQGNWFKPRRPLVEFNDSHTPPVDRWSNRLVESKFRLTNQSSDLLLGNAPAQPQQPQARKPAKIRGATHVSEGGWYLNSDILAVQYMPRGHADPLLAGWSQMVSVIEGGQAAKKIPGGCAQCHDLSTDRLGTTVATNLWRVNTKPANVRTFTKFAHEPHLALPAVSDCRFCHSLTKTKELISDTNIQLIKSDGNADALPNYTSGSFHLPEFTSIKISQCSSCHRPGGANDGCTQCHNYHVGQVGLDWSTTDSASVNR